ncbi:MAG: ABC transporter ATP-binding protein, partial [Ruminococcus sp.]|nr:ABC transporter ATP-binding protein [Ruminococcus sp.]
ELAKTKTVIMISHRLANVKDADSIYVLDSGSLAECGAHKELSEKTDGKYAELWRTQQSLENIGKEAQA